MALTVRTLAPSDHQLEQAAAVFDCYRVHYGQNPDPDAARRWLSERLTSGGLTVTIAADGDLVRGVVTSILVPASLRLGTACSVRDVFVVPEHRGRGVARTMLDHVIAGARAAGAIRVSLRTETENAAALALYTGLGFVLSTGLESLDLML